MDSASSIGVNSTLPNDLIEWYWKHGSKRSGQYQLSRSGFLSPLWDFSDRLRTIPELDRERRCVIGLWGPSQVGKSTLLSSFLDLGADGMGRDSILQWSGDEPIRFEKSVSHPDDRPLSLNPYNFKADASACISRLTLVSEVPEPRCPVEIRLARISQLLHSLALGYLYEWQRDDVTDLKRASEILGVLIDAPARVRSPDRKGFDLAQTASSTLRQLKSSRLKHERYRTLTDDLIDRFLDSSLAVEGREQVAKAIGEVFWDSEKDISNLFSEISKCIEFYRGSCQRIYCSYQVAALLLDMQSYLRAEGGTTFDGERIEPDEALSARILQIGRRSDSYGNIFLEIGNGEPAFTDLVGYAILQAAVWELVIPINTKRLHQRAEEGSADAASFQNLLEQTDILDFPGVSNIGHGGNDRLNSSVIAKRGSHLLFSHLVKRGKTSAMVSASASRSHVDGFCLLLRNQGAFANPDIINDGIRSWRAALAEDKPPIVNVVVTFFGELILDAIRNPEKSSFKGAFNNLEALSNEFFERGNVFPVCFHKYESLIPKTVWDSGESGELSPEAEKTMSAIETAAGRLSSDKDYERWFGSGVDPILDAALVYQGGIPNVVTRLIAQTKGIKKGRYYSDLIAQAGVSISRLLEMALPGKTSEMERKKHLIEKVSKEIAKKVQSNGRYSSAEGKKVSFAVRTLVTLRETELDSVPLRVARNPEAGLKYLAEQLQKWCERQSRPHPNLGIRDPSDAANLVNYLASAVSLNETMEWLAKNFGTITRPNAAQDACRYLSVRLTEQLSPRALEALASSKKEAYESPEAVIQEMANAERGERSEYATCPHYRGVIAPFLSRLEELSKRNVGERPPQEGDTELLKIVGEGYQGMNGNEKN